MRKYINIIIGLGCVFFGFIACSDMNDLHDVYLRDGETTYIGRVDSIQAFSGRERVLIHYWLTDPRVKELHIFWNQKRDSAVVTVPTHEPTNALEVMIGEGGSLIEEGDHTFFFYSHDYKGHRSVVFEKLINVYGERYQATLLNRSLRSKSTNNNNELILEWRGGSSADELGVEIQYMDISGAEKTLFIATEELGETTVIADVDFNKDIQYRTWFEPQENAIDQFSTLWEAIEL